MRNNALIAVAIIASVIGAEALAQTGFDARGGGGIIVGYDARTCDASIEGAMRSGFGGPTSGLVGHWKLDETSGITAFDSSGNGNNGTLNNMDPNTDWVTGRIHGALDFDGNNDWVTVSNDASLEFGSSQDFSISFWYYNRDNTGYWDLIDKTGARGYICNYTFGFDGIECYLYGDSGSETVYSASNATPLENTWYHVVLTVDRDQDSQLYIGGSTSGSAIDVSGIGNIDSGTNLWFGVHDGRLDDVRVYNRVLSSPEIEALSKSSIHVCKNSCPNIGDVCVDGSIYAGLSPDGSVPLYTTPADAGQFSWNDGTTNYVELAMQNCFSISPGAQASCQTGEANTALLVALGTTPSPAPYVAARHCDNLDAHGQTDWYLPSQDELHVLYVNLVDQNSDNTPGGPLGSTFGFNVSGSFPAGYYWSSSENGSGFARGQGFSIGFQSSFNKNGGLSVRCVRKSSTPPLHSWINWGE